MSKRTTVRLLSLLLILFCFRVLAQFLQSAGNIPLLPPFHAWHSATVPYSWLLGSQLVIIAAGLAVITHIQSDRYTCHRRRGKILLLSGGIYFTLMYLRFVLSITVLESHPWFGATLPALFHMVLAGFLLILGMYEISTAGEAEAA